MISFAHENKSENALGNDARRWNRLKKKKITPEYKKGKILFRYVF